MASAMKGGRRISPQIGGLPYAQKIGTRGDETPNETLFERALLSVSSNRSNPAGADDQLLTAEILLERDKPGDPEEALEIINGVMARGPITGELLNAKGVALYQLGRLEAAKNEDAISAYTAAIEKAPTLVSAYFNRALAEKRLDRFGDAKRDFEHYISVESDPDWKKEAMGYLDQLYRDMADGKR